jgi:DNA-binding response OmpR family regulator
VVAHRDGEGSVVAAALEGWGYRVVAAATTAEALDRYGRGVQALFLDASLLAADPAPWREARQRDRSRAPVVLMGLCDDADVDRFRREHASAVLVPPFQLRPLRAAVRALAKEYV